MTNHIVDYVDIVQDDNDKYRVRGRSNNGEIVWTSEQYDTLDWARKVANDSGREVHDEFGTDPLETTEESLE